MSYRKAYGSFDKTSLNSNRHKKISYETLENSLCPFKLWILKTSIPLCENWLNVKGIILKIISIFCVLVKCHLFYSSGCYLSRKTYFLGGPCHIWIEWQPWKWFSKRPKMSAKMSASSYSVLAPVCGTAGCRPVQTASDWRGPGNHLTHSTINPRPEPSPGQETLSASSKYFRFKSFIKIFVYLFGAGMRTDRGQSNLV